MGIDIYLGGYENYESRIKDVRQCFDMAVKLRDSHPRDSEQARVAQGLVEMASSQMWSGKNGYLRSSYNRSGLFNVLDKIFGIESAGLLFPGEWEDDLSIDWDMFLGLVNTLQAVGRCLRHGDPLPVQLEELQTTPNRSRLDGEAFGKRVLEMITGAGLDMVAGADGQHGFYNDDDYGWYVRDALDNLREFGELGKREAAAGKDTKVHISY